VDEERAAALKLELGEENPGALVLDPPFDEALIGIGRRCGQPSLAVYDKLLILRLLMEQGLALSDAIEHFEFNIAGAWVGPHTPRFVDGTTADDEGEEG